MATIGEQLLQPEEGWRRYDDSNSKIMFIGDGWLTTNGDPNYNGGCHYIKNGTSYATFKFYGTKIRYICGGNNTTKLTDNRIIIDGIEETFSQVFEQQTYMCLLYEKVGLPLDIHEVVIKNPSLSDYSETKNFAFDAIDIDSDGYLVHPYSSGIERNNLADMEIGDYISCRYTALTSGQAGYFSELGTCTVGDIPVSGSATPDGKFNFIKVDRGLLIADRVVQHSISWDALRTAGYIEGKVVESYLIRSLSGGCFYADANGNYTTSDIGFGAFPTSNEYDKYIVNSDLDGKIVKGDNSIWNWSNKYTNTRDTLGANNTLRVLRGYTSINAITSGGLVSSSPSVNVGFRPVLEYIEPDGSSKQTNLWY